MNDLVLISFAILFFLSWFIVSITSIVFWIKTPISLTQKPNNFDFTKKFFWWYGFGFFIFLATSIIGSGIVLLSIIIRNSLGV